jgi:REP element-mobilizing transposase RayT
LLWGRVFAAGRLLLACHGSHDTMQPVRFTTSMRAASTAGRSSKTTRTGRRTSTCSDTWCAAGSGTALAYCLMTNHVHLVVRTPEPTLGCGMQYLHSFYALAYNQKYGRIGHLFQTRYGSSRLWTPGRLRLALEYVAENPVAAALCRKPEDWPWSSAAVLTTDDVPQWLARPGRLAILQAELAAASYAVHVSAATSAQVRDGDDAWRPPSAIAASSNAA